MSEEKTITEEEKKTLLIQEMEDFVRSGMGDYDAWTRLDDEIKAALLVARKKVEIERACLIGLAMEGDLGRAEVRAGLYGPDEVHQVFISSIMDRYAREIAPK